jgi:alkylation response protein AidB-like acyl-CoA dehydrogenase
MNFSFTEEQRMMAVAVRELANDIFSADKLRAAFEGAGQRVAADASAERWKRLCELGLMGVLAPEEAGGLALREADFVLIAEESGRAALAEPLVEHAGVCVPLLAELSEHPEVHELLREAAAGSACLAIAHPQNPFVLAADRASHLIVCTADEIHVVRTDQAQLTFEPSIDRLRRLFRADVSLSRSSRIVQGTAANAIAARASQRGALFAAAQCVGLCERMLQMASAYAIERKQFGKPIGSYQAIKHHLANVQVKLEFARPVLYAAATRAASLDARSRLSVSHAKLAASDAADCAARTAVQVHGAMGYSWEVDLHFFMKRAWALTGAWGDRNHHMRQVQQLVFGGEIGLGPEHTFEPLD